MSINLTQDEQWLFELLTDATSLHEPLPPLEGSVYTVLLTRGYTGTRTRIVRIVQYFNADADAARIGGALDALLERRLIEADHEEIGLPDEWLASLTGALRPRGGFSGDVLKRVERSRRSYEADLMERVGRASSGHAVQRVRARIAQAAYRIRLGCFSSTVLFDDVGEELAKACTTRHQLHLQVLMFSPELARAIENDPGLEVDVDRGLQRFKNLFEQIHVNASALNNQPKCELRWLSKAHAEFSGVHRMLIVDDRAWMFNVYRIGVDRGVDGTLYQGSSMREGPSTVHRIVNHYWESAWARAEPKLSCPD